MIRDKNIGDLLSKVVVDYMLDKKGYTYNSDRSKLLYAVGSIIDLGHHDAVIWGGVVC